MFQTPRHTAAKQEDEEPDSEGFTPHGPPVRRSFLESVCGGCSFTHLIWFLWQCGQDLKVEFNPPTTFLNHMLLGN